MPKMMITCEDIESLTTSCESNNCCDWMKNVTAIINKYPSLSVSVIIGGEVK